MLSKFADTLMAHRAGILAYYDYPISTGPLEGTTIRSRTMNARHMASGIWTSSS